MHPQYLPSLLDRLEVDRDPSSAGITRGISISEFKAMVIRDIARILNQSRFLFSSHGADSAGERNGDARFPFIAASVLNYGVDLPLGAAISREILEQVRFGIGRSLETFEPRVVNVRVAVWEEEDASATQFLTASEERRRTGRPVFIIEADILAEPFLEQICLKTELDLISGECVLL